MKRYAISDAATGAILRVAVCSDDNANVQALAGEISTHSDTADPALHYMRDGAPVPYPAKPSSYHAWNGASWIDPRPLDRVKADRWAAVKEERDRRVTGPKVTSVGTFDADASSQNNLNKVIALLEIAVARGYPDSANYTLADNTRAAFTKTQLQTAALEMGAQVQGLYDQAGALRSTIESATTAAAVEGMSWPA